MFHFHIFTIYGIHTVWHTCQICMPYVNWSHIYGRIYYIVPYMWLFTISHIWHVVNVWKWNISYMWQIYEHIWFTVWWIYRSLYICHIHYQYNVTYNSGIYSAIYVSGHICACSVWAMGSAAAGDHPDTRIGSKSRAGFKVDLGVAEF